MIPTYQDCMRPTLEAALNGKRHISAVVEELADHFQLTEDERAQVLPSGKQTIIRNRVHWARSYLKQAGLVRNPQRGWYELTETGRQVALDRDQQVNSDFLRNFDQFNDFLQRSKGDVGDDPVPAAPAPQSQTTPDEDILQAYKLLNDTLAANLLEQVRDASPAFFEDLLVDLLLQMGYGGSSEEAGRALGRSGDNGIDGVIDQDPLGVDQIYIQAKRYADGNTVGSGDIRDFFGALNIRRATKGIFFTTSAFTASARETADALGTRIILIDGTQLARLMIRYNVGCRDRTVLHVKQIDESYFDDAG
ncbi:restriction endonuclease [Salipiger pallidus]|uniref:Restriction endonuclease n=1 Tax=Salipiger pallidus TaxID=1775170 RepID=A0A8J2ZJX8_9RHOB|nr:restriction endonuclease [Salipiger pallidus]GGG73443.1 restriction endonuclease [Salipiger pallidus]